MTTKATEPKQSQQTPQRRLGFTVSGLVNDIRQTKKGDSYMLKISTDSAIITVFSKQNGLTVGSHYEALLRGLKGDKYGLTAFEEERLG